MIKLCAICDKEFNATQRTEKYCCMKCAYEAIKNKQKLRYMNDKEMTTEDYKKQQELDSRAFQDLTTEEKIGRLVRVIKETNNTIGYAFNRIATLEDENRKLKQHEHNSNGDVVIKISSNNTGMVMGANKMIGKSLLD